MIFELSVIILSIFHLFPSHHSSQWETNHEESCMNWLPISPCIYHNIISIPARLSFSWLKLFPLTLSSPKKEEKPIETSPMEKPSSFVIGVNSLFHSLTLSAVGTNSVKYKSHVGQVKYSVILCIRDTQGCTSSGHIYSVITNDTGRLLRFILNRNSYP